jgi:hypothetical protein
MAGGAGVTRAEKRSNIEQASVERSKVIIIRR